MTCSKYKDDRATAVLLSWRRRHNLPRIVESLNALPFCNEVIMWNNAPDEADLSGLTSCRVLSGDGNLYTYARFLAAARASYPWIITQDDDYLVNNWEQIWAARMEDRVVAAVPEWHAPSRGTAWGDVQELLLGWGSVFRLEHLSALDLYVSRYGFDEILHRKADRLFTMLLNRRHVTLPADVTDLWEAGDPNVALASRPDHQRLTMYARERAFELLGVEPPRGIQ